MPLLTALPEWQALAAHQRTVGALSLLSGPIFGTLSDRIGRRAGLALVFGLQALAYALFASGLLGWPLALAVGCYGATVWSIPVRFSTKTRRASSSEST